MQNTILYPIHLFVKNTKLNLIYIGLSILSVIFFYQYQLNVLPKTVIFETSPNTDISYDLTIEDLALIDQINQPIEKNYNRNYLNDFSVNKFSQSINIEKFSDLTVYDKIIGNLYLSEVQSRALKKLNLEEQKNLKIINGSFQNIIDREVYKIFNKEKYYKSFRTMLDESDARSFVIALLDEAHVEAQINIQSLINREISSLNIFKSQREEAIKTEFKSKIRILETKNKFEEELYALNIDRSIKVLTNNLDIASKLNLTEIQSNVYNQKTILTEPTTVYEMIDPVDRNNTIESKDIKTNEFVTNNGNFLDTLNTTLSQTNEDVQDKVLIYSLNNPIYLLGTKLIDEEIKILKQGDHISLRDNREFNRLLQKQYGASLESSLVNDNFISNISVRIDKLENLSNKMNNKFVTNFNYINYNPSSFDYEMPLPNIVIVIIFAIFLGIIASITHLIIREAYNYKPIN